MNALAVFGWLGLVSAAAYGLVRVVSSWELPEPKPLPRPVFDDGRIVALAWPCGHTSDPGEDHCPDCAGGGR